jgi:hypothetical protein
LRVAAACQQILSAPDAGIEVGEKAFEGGSFGFDETSKIDWLIVTIKIPSVVFDRAIHL